MCIVMIGVNNLMSENIKELTQNLSNVLLSNNIYLNDEILSELDLFVGHFRDEHRISEYNINRLIDGFIAIPITLNENTQQCKYYQRSKSDNRCLLSANWGKNNLWNKDNASIRKDVYQYFSSSVMHFVNNSNIGLPLLPNPNDVITEYVALYIEDLEINATALSRISTEHQLKAMQKEKDDFIGLIKSINLKSDEVAEYIEQGFLQECNFVYLKPLEGKANWTTLLFRVPYITNLFIRLYKSTGKKLVAKINGIDTILNLVDLQKAIAKGLETTEQEKIIAQIPNAYNKNMKGHLTQLLQFAFGLFQYEAKELVTMIEDSSKGLIPKDYLESCVASAKNGIIKYKNAFLLEDQALGVYRDKLDEFEELIKQSTKYEEFDSSIKSTICGLKIRKSWVYCPRCAIAINKHK